MMTLPIFLLDKTGNLKSASLFTVVALLSTLILSKVAARLSAKYHSLRLTAVCDFGAVVLVSLLFIYITWFPFSLPLFLTFCGCMGLLINLPLYAKQYLIHRHFVPEENQNAFSLVQGRVDGLVFIAAVFLSGALYEKIGFNGILVLDILSYLPSVLIFFAMRERPVLGYSQSTHSLQRTQIKDLYQKSSPLLYLYLFVHGVILFLAVFRSQMLLSTFKDLFNRELDLTRISVGAAAGTGLSLLLQSGTNRLYAWLGKYSIYSFPTILISLSLLLLIQLPSLSQIIVVTFAFTELLALGLMTQRQLQKDLQANYSLQSIAFLSLVVGCLVSIVGVEFLVGIIVEYSLSVGLLSVGVAVLVVLVPFSNQIFKPRASVFLVLLIPHILFGYTYNTAMSDEPRTNFNLANNSLSEDERFLTNNVMCGFFRKDPNKGLLPDLALSWDSLPGNKKFLIRLRKDRKDSEGRIIDANYVIESLRRVIQLSKSERTDLRGFKWIRGFSRCTKHICQLEGIQRNDDFAISISLEKPWPNFIGLLEKEALVIYRPGVDAKFTPVSCGSYKIAERDSKHFLLTSVEKDSQGPANFQINFMDPESAYKQFCRGTINDLLFFMPSREDLARHGCKQNDYEYQEVFTSGLWFINMATPRLQKEKQLHKQLIASLNVDEFRSAWGFNSKAHDSILPREFGKFGAYQKADWIKKKSYRGSIPVVVEYIVGTPQAIGLESALANWGKVAGINFKIVAKPFTEFVKDLIGNKADIFVYAELANDSNPIHYISFFYEAARNGLPKAEMSYLNRVWDRYVNDMGVDALSELNRLILNSQYFVPLFVMKRPLVVRKPYFLKEYSDFGLANVSIESFRAKREGSVD